MNTALLAALPTVVISGVALWYIYYHHYWKRKEEEDADSPQPSISSKVLFFPDEATAHSLSYASKRSVESPVEQGSLSVLISTLQEAKKSLDVCVFVLSCKELGDVLINAHRSGVVVRVVTDNEQSTVTGSQVGRLRRVGIQVRNDNSSYFMHHKFALVDESVLVNGSLNWTLQGVCGNQENVMITASLEMVEPFQRQFEKLWDMYDPEKLDHFQK